MTYGIDTVKTKKKKYKTKIERDTDLYKDLKETYYHRGKAIGEISRKLLNKKKYKEKKSP